MSWKTVQPSDGGIKTVLFSVLNHQDQYNKMIRSEDLFATIIQFSVDRWDLVALTFSKTCHIIPHFYDFFFMNFFPLTYS